MSYDTETVECLLNSIAAQLPLIDKSDYAPLMTVMKGLEQLAAVAGIPKAMLTMAERADALAQKIVMGETDFKSGLKKLSDSIEKMMRGVDPSDVASEQALAKKMALIDTGDKQPASVQNPTTTADGIEVQDLLIKFGSTQQNVLEDFEAAVLEFEKGDPQAGPAINRILHTWKGEFGVLELMDYSKFMHAVEDALESSSLGADSLFKLKDILAIKLAAFSRGERAILTDAEQRQIVGAVNQKTVEPAVSEQHEPATVKSSAEPEVSQSGAAIASCDPSLVSDFITESRDHMHAAETLLLELETDPTHKENINTIFRAWHTIKGVAGFLGLKEINALAHRMENTMDLARKGELPLGAGPIDLLLECNDCLKNLVAAVEGALQGQDFVVPENYPVLIKRLESPQNIVEPQSATIPVAAAKPLGELLVDSGAATRAAVDHALELQKEGDTRKMGEILVQEGEVPARSVGSALAAQTSARVVKTVEDTIRVPVNRIDQLVDSIGEAVIAQSMITAHPSLASVEDQSLHTRIAHANMIMRQIQELAMSLRMVSVKSTFQKMARLARDLSKKCNRDIDFVTEGDDTELDKSVVENIGDPLIHMIRNSIDHGIEAAEDRAKTGKPLRAMVKLRAFHRAGSIFIEIIDDGKGLDKEAILAKAVSRGLCKAEDNFTDQEIFQFIFLPGFSTAKVVTDVSGRGVGMDVVRRNIEALRGSVEIASTMGKGTTFSIRLPLTLAIVDGMIVRAGGDNYIIPTLAIMESIKPAADQIQTVMNKGRMIKVRGDLIPLVHLSNLLKKQNEAFDCTSGIVMIVEDMLAKKIGLFLDEIIGQQQVVIKTLGEGMHDIPGVTGGAIMNDGGVSLILDVGGIVKMAGE